MEQPRIPGADARSGHEVTLTEGEIKSLNLELVASS
jgi:hypothetical protein